MQPPKHPGSQAPSEALSVYRRELDAALAGASGSLLAVANGQMTGEATAGFLMLFRGSSDGH